MGTCKNVRISPGQQNKTQDDFSENGHNAAFGAKEKISMKSLGTVVATAKAWIASAKQDGSFALMDTAGRPCEGWLLYCVRWLQFLLHGDKICELRSDSFYKHVEHTQGPFGYRFWMTGTCSTGAVIGVMGRIYHKLATLNAMSSLLISSPYLSLTVSSADKIIHLVILISEAELQTLDPLSLLRNLVYDMDNHQCILI